MADERLRAWEKLFGHALSILDEAVAAGTPESGWSFGGGTVLMRRYRHRVSRDVDIFVPDPQVARVCDTAAERQGGVAHCGLRRASGLRQALFPGRRDRLRRFGALTADPTTAEILFGRTIQVETSAEIIAKKIWYRATEFTARDLFDLALVAHREPGALARIASIFQARRDALLKRLAARDAALREDFAALDVLDFSPSYEECVATLRRESGGAR